MTCCSHHRGNIVKDFGMILVEMYWTSFATLVACEVPTFGVIGAPSFEVIGVKKIKITPGIWYLCDSKVK